MNRLAVVLREAAREKGPATAVEVFRTGVAERKINAGDYSLREMAQTFLGDDWYEKLDRYNKMPMQLREAGSAEAVDASHFSAITGQLLIDRVHEKYKHATKIGDQIFERSPITNGNLGTQIEPWLSRVRNMPETVQPAMPYGTTGYDPMYVTYPGPEKFGSICYVTMEHVFSDLTGQVNESADSVGEMVGLREEYYKAAVFLGAINNHSWNGTAYNTYQASTPWINSLSDFTFVDYRSMNRMEQLFVNMTDPTTGFPIQIDVKDVFVMPTALYTAKRILNATMVRSGNEASDTGVLFESGNPLSNYNVLTSSHFRNVAINGVTINGKAIASAPVNTTAKAETIVVVGDFKKAFRWRQWFPMRVVQAPPQSPQEFTQDIVMSVKANAAGIACVKDPRYVAFGYNSSAT